MLHRLLRHVVPLDDQNCRLKTPAVKERCVRDTLRHTFDIGVLKSIENNSTTTKYIYNESANTVDGFDIAFDASDFWDFRNLVNFVVHIE